MSGPRRSRRPIRRPGGDRWSDSVRKFEVESLTGTPVGEGWRRRIVYEVSRTPALLSRAEAAPLPRTPRELERAHLDALRGRLGWAPSTLALHFAALRRLVRWSGNPLANDPGAWATPAGVASRRRWLDREDLARLYRATRGRERVLVALEGFNGLRRVEVLRLRARDVDLDGRRLRVLGKGRNGGKWRTIPMSPETLTVLRVPRPGVLPDDRLVAVSRSGADLMLQRAVVRSGLRERGVRVSHHDLRRTFGRLSHQAGMDLVQLKNLYGHSSLNQTVHYIGLDEDEMRVGLDRLARMMGPLLAPRSPSARRYDSVAAPRVPWIRRESTASQR